MHTINYSKELKGKEKASKEFIERNGLDQVKAWSQSPECANAPSYVDMLSVYSKITLSGAIDDSSNDPTNSSGKIDSIDSID